MNERDVGRVDPAKAASAVSRDLDERASFELLETLPAIVYSVEPEPPYAPLYVSQGIAILGYTREEWLDRPERWMESIHPEDRERVLRASAHALRLRHPLDCEYRMLKRDGSVIWIHDRGAFVPEGDSGVRWRGIMLDVTARRTAEDALREAEEQLRHSQRLELAGRLAGGMAHEFNNLLTIMTCHLGFIAQELRDRPEALKDVGEVRSAAMRAADLVRQLLGFARKQLLTPTVLDANEVVQRAVRLTRQLLPSNVDVRLDLSRDRLPIKADPVQLEQVFAELIENARDALPDGGTLTIRTGISRIAEGRDALEERVEPGEYVRLSVADSGIGMNAETLRRAFEPFFTTSTVGRRAGLGLSSVHGIVKQSGGFVTVESQPGRGTAVHAHLPIDRPSA